MLQVKSLLGSYVSCPKCQQNVGMFQSGKLAEHYKETKRGLFRYFEHVRFCQASRITYLGHPTIYCLHCFF